MPRPLFHATLLPGPAAGSGPIALLLRVLMLGVALFLAFFFVALAVVLGAIFLLLRALGLGGKTKRSASFGAVFREFHGTSSGGRSGADSVNEPPFSHAAESTHQQDTVKQLEEFHGSLDEFLKQRKDQ